jgi:succinate-semialdehyde dehydrogenase/glutarate-semialdehyde dehydrogenase
MIAARRERDALAMASDRLLIGGEWRAASDGRMFSVEDPATAIAIAEVADATPEDAMAALTAAADAQLDWAAQPPNERSEILYRVFQTLGDRIEELALLMTLEMGKPIAEARAELVYSAEFFRWFSGEALRLDGYYKTAGNGNGRVLVARQPVGPCLLITPWNFPTAMGARKIAPAIAAGCTMVVKPAGSTPLSMLALARLLEEAGLPPGVLNVITSSSSAAVSSPLIADPRLRKLSFTGSTEVGSRLIEQSARNVLKVSMELGGNAPFLIFEDADLDDAVEGAVVAKMRNMGEACVAANRFLVAESVADEFAGALGRRMGALRIGPGVADGVDVGPMIDSGQRDKVDELVRDARKLGARVLTGGRVGVGDGYFYEPTVLTDVPAAARIWSEEIFGPVAPVRTFSSEQEAISTANSTEYGLVAYVYTRDVKRALRVCERLDAGMIGLNQGMVSNAGAPFGGVKQSGIGREGGNEGIHEYLETKYVAISAD